MWIKRINVHNCRILENVSLEFSPDLNIIRGLNASGKTSLLEALSILSTGRSFRSKQISSVITHNKKKLLVTAEICNSNGIQKIGIEKQNDQTKIRIDRKHIRSQAELSKYLPITIIDPDSVKLISGSPSLRRSYIDWIAFYIFPDFHYKWKSYQHILKQRNYCLKNKKYHSTLNKWTEELASLQPELTQYRQSAIEILKPLFKKISDHLLKGIEVDILYTTGFPPTLDINKDSLIEHYNKKLEQDIFLKRTSTGIHRADLKIMLNSQAAESVASRGQLKLLSIALLIAQSTALLQDTATSEKGIILVDDLSSELDAKNERCLFDFLTTLKQQLIITGTRQADIKKNDSVKMFHVKHGVIKPCEITLK